MLLIYGNEEAFSSVGAETLAEISARPMPSRVNTAAAVGRTAWPATLGL